MKTPASPRPLEPSKLAWLLSLEEAVQRELPSLKESAQHLLFAHAAMECGWGTAKAYRHGYNFGNITAGPAWQGAKWLDVGGDLEYRDDGTIKTIDQWWRAYSTLDDAVADYWDFLGPSQNRGRYVKARNALVNGDAISFAIELSKAGYYTLPAQEYARRLGQVLQIVKRELERPT